MLLSHSLCPQPSTDQGREGWQFPLCWSQPPRGNFTLRPTRPEPSPCQRCHRVHHHRMASAQLRRWHWTHLYLWWASYLGQSTPAPSPASAAQPPWLYPWSCGDGESTSPGERISPEHLLRTPQQYVHPKAGQETTRASKAKEQRWDTDPETRSLVAVTVQAPEEAPGAPRSRNPSMSHE